jgi:hypothetical protein
MEFATNIGEKYAMTIKHLLTLLFLLYFSYSFAQFAIVTDKDTFVNIREGGTTNNKVLDKLENGSLIFCFENKGNWTNIDYEKNGKTCHGYVYKDRYRLVSDFPAFSVSKKSENSITLKLDSLEVCISQSEFDKKEHTFKYVKGNATQIELIDDKHYWGMDGGMPNTQFEKISVKIGQKTIILPKKALEGLYQPNIHKVEVNYDKSNEIIYIQTMNSDGAGSYEVIWKIEKGIYKDRLIAYGF